MYLESSGIQNLLVEGQIYRCAVVNVVMSGGNYIWGKRGMPLIADKLVFSELFDKIDELVTMMRDPSKNQVNITSQWSKGMNILDKFEEASNIFKTSDSA